MKLLKDIKNSIYGPNYYNELLSKPVSYSLKYYFLFSLILSLLVAVYLSIIFMPAAKLFFDDLETKITKNYPQGLKVEIKNGQAFANVEQPYFIKMPKSVKEGRTITETENIFVIDTNNEFDLAKFYSYKTAIVLNKSSVSYYEDSGVAVQLLKNSPDFSVDKDKIVSFVGKIKPFANSIYPAFFIAVWIGSFIVLAVKLIYLFFAGLLIWLAVKIKKMEIGYLRAYQLGIHLMTPVIILTLIMSTFKIQMPYLFTVLLCLMAMININNYSKTN